MQISQQDIRKICSSAIYKRGIDYFNLGRVHMKKRSRDSFTAAVDGEELYSISVKLGENGEISDCFCTCPYYETMGTACKHIVAACEQRRRELLGERSGGDLNDKISEKFISDFCTSRQQRNYIPVKFEICIRKGSDDKMNYGVRISLLGTMLDSPEEFLQCYLNGRCFMINRKINYSPSEYCFEENEEKIISLLAEGYENRVLKDNLYIKSVGEIPIGVQTLKKLIDMIADVDYKIILNNVDLGRVLITHDNPDILVDISAVFGEITMFAANCGTALVPSAELIYYEGQIFVPDKRWSRAFLPLYNALAAKSRTQLTFKGENALAFATHVLPEMKKSANVITDGLDEYVISEKPRFTVYTDYDGKNIKAKIKASYGKINFFMPGEDGINECIVVRDKQSEDEIMRFFDEFSYFDGYYAATDDDVIYDFLTERINALKENYTVIQSEMFSDIKLYTDVNLNVRVDFDQSVNLLEAEPDTKLSNTEIAEILSAVRLKNKFYRSENGEFYDISAVTKKMLTFDSIFDGKIEKKQIPIYNLLYLYASDGNDIHCSERLLDFVEKVKQTNAQIPTKLKEVLREYQVTGINWMKQLSTLGFGGILADDMGLGKTIQALSFIKSEENSLPTLIVTPSSLTYNWLHEIAKFLPNAKAVVIDGTPEEREKKLKEVSEYDFVIVSYALLRRDEEMYVNCRFEYCFLDEAQAIKNPQTMSAKAVKKINAKGRFALTGTPIENSLGELWSIFDFLMPGYLKNYESFKKNYEIPVLKNSDENALARLRDRIKPFVLRRMKKDVLTELPDKIEEVIYAKMTDEQEKMYVAYKAIAKNKALAAMCEGTGANTEILTLLLRLRQISCHPYLFDSAYDAQSGKLNLLYEMLDTALSNGHRVLVFSQFTSMLSMIAKGLEEKNINYFRIDGSTPSQKRTELAQRFNDGENDVFIISLKAGGTGLNLTGADTVIHFDPWWNPAVTDQASDRVYRIGQTKNVHVIRLASENTIEAKIIKLQENKRRLAGDIVNVNNSTLSNLSNEEIISLFD